MLRSEIKVIYFTLKITFVIWLMTIRNHRKRVKFIYFITICCWFH